MIDNYENAMQLMESMQQQLPIPAYPSKGLAEIMQQKGMILSKDSRMTIQSVHYMGDEGGIGVELAYGDDQKAVFIVSLTHCLVPKSHPLARKITLYQEKRRKKLKKANQPAGKRQFRPGRK